MNLDVWRVFSTGASRSAHKYSKSSRKADFINDLVYGRTQAPGPNSAWHPFIRRPFSFPLPTPKDLFRRFSPPQSNRNCLYGSISLLTSVKEAAYHFMRERVGKGMSATSEERHSISIKFKDASIFDLRDAPDVDVLMSRNDYRSSWNFTAKNPTLDSILYPSCRDEHQGLNVITYRIQNLAKSPTAAHVLGFSYDDKNKAVEISPSSIRIKDMPITVTWDAVGGNV